MPGGQEGGKPDVSSLTADRSAQDGTLIRSHSKARLTNRCRVSHHHPLDGARRRVTRLVLDREPPVTTVLDGTGRRIPSAGTEGFLV
jgi:hypothetical protein